MVFIKVYALLLLVGFCSPVVSIFASVQSGSVAPDFILRDTTGAEHQLSDFKGKFVVLEWTNHKCPFVAKHYENGDMQALQKEFVDSGAIWLQIVSSAEGKQGYVTAEEGEALRTRLKMASTAMLLDSDGTVGRAYDARVTPHMFLINPEGILVYQGAIDSIRSVRASDVPLAENYLRKAYESAQAGEPVAEASTRPYGCGIKY